MNYYCNCTKESDKKANAGKSPIRKVEVCKDGICNDCGFYAVACKVDVKSTKDLFAALRISNE